MFPPTNALRRTISVSDRKLLWARLCVGAAAAAFLAIGICRGEAALILQKAVTICLECIGLG